MSFYSLCVRRWGRALLSLVSKMPLAVATSVAVLASCTGARAQYFNLRGNYPLEFYDIDYSSLADPANRTNALDALHYIPLPITSESYLSLGGEFREQLWSWNNSGWGLKSPLHTNYMLQRVLGDIDLHFDRHFSAFVQIGRYDAFGKTSPSSTDEGYGRVQQGFLEVKEELGPAEARLRVGRQELMLGSGRMVWVSDSSNARTTHDGVRVTTTVPGEVTIDLAYTSPVLPTIYPFQDWDSHAGSFFAAYATEEPLPGQLHVDEYYLARHNVGATYAGLTGNEERSTLGGRLWGAFGSFKYDGDIDYQFGTFDNKPISAFGTSTRVLYTFQDVAWEPGLQMQGSYFSGTGGSTFKTIGTFAAPFPRPTMFNYPGLATLANVIEAYPAFLLNPTQDFTFRFGPEFLWRASRYDAVYIARQTPLAKTMSTKDRASYIGANLIASVQWKLTSNITFFCEYLHGIAGPAITLAGGHGTDVGVAQIDFNF